MKGLTKYLAAGMLALLAFPLMANADCAGTASTPGLTTFYSDSWGIEPNNRRFQAADRTSINAGNVGSLKLQWAYGLSNNNPRSYPLVTEDTIFIGDSGRGLVALDRATGCTRWVTRVTTQVGNSPIKTEGQVGTAIVYRRTGDTVTLYYTERRSGLYAVNAADGKLLWHSAIVEEPIPLYSGTPLVHGNVVYVPISSQEVGLAINPFYGCCTTSGGMAAFDATTGKELWFQPTIQSPPKVTHKHFLFVHNRAPSGAPVWTTPTLDPVNQVLYYGSGQNYSLPATDTSDAIFALNANDGSIKWMHQFMAGDAYNVSCDLHIDHPNCPKPQGPDRDFGAPPILVNAADGTPLLIAGEKSGDLYALKPDTGEVVWHDNIGRGGALGGIHWGMAANQQAGLVFVPISDISGYEGKGPPKPGLNAVDISTGEIRWSHERKPRCADRMCSAGLSAAIIATPDLVFTASLDGYLEAYDAATGKLLWSDDTWKDFTSVNGVKTSGGAFDAHGPMVAGDQVIVSSGYGQYFQRPGNALLVYHLEAQP